MNIPSLKTRKAIYLVLVIPSAIPWLMMSIIGITIGIGLLGLAGLFGFRSILLLPIRRKKQRRTYNILLSLGILPISIYVPFIALNLSNDWTNWLLLISGLMLFMVAICLVYEINFARKEV